MRYDPDLIKELRAQGFKRISRDKDVVVYEKTEGHRTLNVQLWADGGHRASHMLNGRGSTIPTSFSGVYSLRKALTKERTRMDHDLRRR